MGKRIVFSLVLLAALVCCGQPTGVVLARERGLPDHHQVRSAVSRVASEHASGMRRNQGRSDRGAHEKWFEQGRGKRNAFGHDTRRGNGRADSAHEHAGRHGREDCRRGGDREDREDVDDEDVQDGSSEGGDDVGEGDDEAQSGQDDDVDDGDEGAQADQDDDTDTGEEEDAGDESDEAQDSSDGSEDTQDADGQEDESSDNGDGTQDVDGGEDTSIDGEGGKDVTLPTVTFTAVDTVVEHGGTTSLGWYTEEAETCVASGAQDWDGVVATSGTRVIALEATTTYTIECGNAHGSSTASVEVGVVLPNEEEQTPVTGKVLITEVLFDPGPSDLQGTDAENEWIEVYNGTNVDIDLAGWTIGDGVATDTIASATLALPAGEYLLVTRSATTDTFWAYGPGTVVVHLDATLGSSGLSNSGESAMLYDAAGVMVDAVSWGTVSLAMDPSVDITAYVEGESIGRVSPNVDTDTATDWAVLATPTPGA